MCDGSVCVFFSSLSFRLMLGCMVWGCIPHYVWFKKSEYSDWWMNVQLCGLLLSTLSFSSSTTWVAHKFLYHIDPVMFSQMASCWRCFYTSCNWGYFFNKMVHWIYYHQCSYNTVSARLSLQGTHKYLNASSKCSSDFVT